MHSVLVSSPKRLAKSVGFPLLGFIDMRALACTGAEGIPRNGHSWVLREPCSQDTPGPPADDDEIETVHSDLSVLGLSVDDRGSAPAAGRLVPSEVRLALLAGFAATGAGLGTYVAVRSEAVTNTRHLVVSVLGVFSARHRLQTSADQSLSNA